MATHHMPTSAGPRTTPSSTVDGTCLSVHALIHQRALAHPHALAVSDGTTRLTFAELDQAASALAATLQHRGAGPETLIGVSVARSADLFVALLAVLKAGAAFVPLDRTYPVERLHYMVQDAGIALWLMGPGIEPLEGFDRRQVVAMAQARAAQPEHLAVATVYPQQLAYLIYTSGSTGAPKGVAVEHGPLAMHCQAIVERYGVEEGDVVLHFASVNFDGAHEGWLAPLLAGAAIVVTGDALWDPEQTVATLQREGVTIAAFPPAYLRTLAHWCADHQVRLPGVRSWTTGGEAMSGQACAVIQAALAPRRLVNGYGPTETVITPLLWTSDDPTELGDLAWLPIGTPVGARHVALQPLDADGPSDEGELLIGGYGLARGYHRRPALTAERFLPDPDGPPGARRYHTGDRVRRLASGAYAYLGRTDDQLKLRGLRIEPGEIERCLLDSPGVREAAVVLCQTQAGPQLVGFFSADQGNGHVEVLRQALEQRLPAHMVPTHLVALEALPRLPNGKLDRGQLTAPRAHRPAWRAPQGPVAQTLAAIWEAHLHVIDVGLDDHFFELGGNSLIAASVQAQVRERLHPDFRLALLFEAPRLADLAALIERDAETAEQAEAQALNRLEAMLDLAEEHNDVIAR
jgi:amino acid adenylation domain-containing protein